MKNSGILRRTNVIVVFLASLAVVSLLFGIGLGPVTVSPVNVAKILLSRVPLIGGHIPHGWAQLDENIVIGLRLPRVCLGLIVGASLAVIGVTMQALVRNQLADPFILGVSSGAAATATLGMLFGVFAFFGKYSLSISAFIGSAVTIIFVYTISRVRGRINITQLLLSGVAISMIMDGVTRIITLAAPNAQGLHNATFWMSGSLAGAKWGYLTLPLVVLL
ncbi:MAG: iron ABC transporter permease, partial [Oscillospiraceae bacterium]|nr:iron ABC transporter permease [Oscillospiraceae bacterium]